MSNLVLGSLFLLMLLAPCVIDLSGWWKMDPELEALRQADEERAAARAEADALNASEALTLQPPCVLENAAPVTLLPVAGGPDELYALAMIAEREALVAKQAARRAAAAAMDASARAAAARAEAASAAAMLAAREADAATEAAQAALATYEQVRGTEVRGTEVALVERVRQAA